MMEVKGLCEDCLFIRQDWLCFEDKKTGQLKKEVDWCCSLCNIFKRQDGYCDMWEPK